jgi:hypothetical protein
MFKSLIFLASICFLETATQFLGNILNTNEPSEMMNTPEAESGGLIEKGGQ